MEEKIKCLLGHNNFKKQNKTKPKQYTHPGTASTQHNAQLLIQNCAGVGGE